jgi:hypothetical protein
VGFHAPFNNPFNQHAPVPVPHIFAGEQWYSYKEAAQILGTTLEELYDLNAAEVFRHTETMEHVQSSQGNLKKIIRIWLRASDVDHLRAQADMEDHVKKMHLNQI